MYTKVKTGILCSLALVLMAGTIAFSVNAMSDETENESVQNGEAAAPIDAVEAEEKYEALIERAEEVEEKFANSEQMSDAEMDEIILEDSEVRTELAEYYMEYGWDNYDGVVYADKETLIQKAENNIEILHDIIQQVENDYTSTEPTKEEFIAFYKNRIILNENFILKVQSSDDLDVKALSGEYEYMYFLGDLETN